VGLLHMARVMLIDPDLVVRRRMRTILEHSHGLEVVAEADCAADAAAAVAKSAPDVLVMSPTTPDVAAIATDHATLHPLAHLPGVMLVPRTGTSDLRELPRRQILGFVAEESAATDVAEAVRRAAVGESYVSSVLLAADTQPPHDLGPKSDPYEFLTPRERQILALIVDGKAPKEIAATLGRSAATVRSHHARILAKLHLRNDVELGRFLAEHRPPDSPEA